MNQRRKQLWRRWYAAFAILGAVGSLRAGDAPVAADTYVSSITSPNDLTHSNYGTAVNLNVGSGGQALIQFDLSKLPDSVPQAVMVVFANKVNAAGSMDVYSLGGPWTETGVSLNGGTSPATTTPLPATVNYLGSIGVTASGVYYTLDISTQVNRWLAGTTPNYGLLLLPSAGSPISATFDAKENVSTSHAAYLNVLTGATGSGASPGGSNGQLQINNAGAFGGITLPAAGLLKGAAGPSFGLATAGIDYAPATTGTTILKGNGSGAFSNAVAGTDYAAPNASTTINGSACALGSSCTVSAGSPARILYSPSGGTVAKCQAGLAAAAFSLAATGAPQPVCETDGIQAYLEFAAGTLQTVYDRFDLPVDWAGTLKVNVAAYATSVSAPAINLYLSCIGMGAVANPVWGAAQAISLTPRASNGRTLVTAALSTAAAFANSTCGAGDLVEWRLAIAAGAAADLRLLSVKFTE